MPRNRWVPAAFGLCAVLSLSGCVVAAVEAARYVGDKVVPPQPTLAAEETFFEKTIHVSLRVGAVESHHGRVIALVEHEGPHDSDGDGADPADAPVGKRALWTTFRNQGASTVEFTVVSEESEMGKDRFPPRRIALAPGQYFRIPPTGSLNDDNLARLEVALTLSRGEVVERRVIALLPAPSAKR